MLLWLSLLFITAPLAQEGGPLELEKGADSPEWYLTLDTESNTVLGSAHYPQGGGWHTSWLVYRIPNSDVHQRKGGAFLTIDVPPNGALLVVAMGSEEGSPESFVKGWIVASNRGYAAFRVWTHGEADAWEMAYLISQTEGRKPHG